MQDQSNSQHQHQLPKRGRGRRRGTARKQQVAEEQNRKKSRSRSRSNQRRREHAESQSASEDEEHHSQHHDNEQQSDSENDIKFQPPSKTASIQTFADSIRQVFVDFFFKCDHDKGFVFTVQQRKKLKKEETRLMKKNGAYKAINWKDEHQWDPDREMEKVEKVFKNNTLNLSNQKNEELKTIFKQASGMFADETTSEVYSLLFAILQIATIPNSEQQKQKLKTLVKEVLSEQQKWRFFGFHFSTYFQSKLQKTQQQKTHQLLTEQLLVILKQKL